MRTSHLCWSPLLLACLGWSGCARPSVEPDELTALEEIEASLHDSGWVVTDSLYDEDESLVLTDWDTKDQVLVENFGVRTRVTDVESGEYIEVIGDLARSWDDYKYTEMMREKRLADSQQPEVQSALSGSGGFSIRSKFTSPKYTKTGSSAVKTTLSNLLTYDTSSNYITIELKRSVSFWKDTSYGTQQYWIDYDSGFIDGDAGGTRTWSSATVSGSYYVIITRTNNGSWSTGNYSLSD